MGSNQIKRNYRLPTNNLINFVHTLSQCMTRDIAEFTEYAVTAADITAMITLANQLNDLPDDDYVLQEYLANVQAKNELAEILMSLTKKLATRVELHYGRNSSQYRNFNISKFIGLTEGEFVTQAGLFSKFLEDNLAALAKEGVTAAMLTEYDGTITALKNQRSVVSDLGIKRKDKTTERIDIGNDLYELVSRYCDIGKRIWKGVNPAKYNEYVIYGHSGGIIKPPVGLAYRPGDFVVSWQHAENATSYELQYAHDGVNWIDVYEGDEDAVQYIPAVEGWAYFRCRGRNSKGFGEYSEVLKAGYYQHIPPPNNIQAKLEELTNNFLLLSWDVVPSATVYKIYTSVVPIGAVANSYIFLAKQKVNSYSGEIERGKRHYFRLTAENQAQWSAQSIAIYIDVE